MITVSLQGDKELIDKINRIGNKSVSLLRKQLTVSAKKLKTSIQYFTPVHTGALKKSISTHAQISKDRTYMYTTIGVRSNYKTVSGRMPVYYAGKIEHKTKYTFKIFRNMYKFIIKDFADNLSKNLDK